MRNSLAHEGIMRNSLSTPSAPMNALASAVTRRACGRIFARSRLTILHLQSSEGAMSSGVYNSIAGKHNILREKKAAAEG